jgi:hypothetical protein
MKVLAAFMAGAPLRAIQHLVDGDPEALLRADLEALAREHAGADAGAEEEAGRKTAKEDGGAAPRPPARRPIRDIDIDTVRTALLAGCGTVEEIQQHLEECEIRCLGNGSIRRILAMLCEAGEVAQRGGRFVPRELS